MIDHQNRCSAKFSRYLLHRISNDRDHGFVHDLVPDNLHESPSLPVRHAIQFGWALQLPVLLKINAPPKHYRPKLDDLDFWAVWSGQGGDGAATEGSVDWKALADGWQQIGAATQGQDSENNDE